VLTTSSDFGRHFTGGSEDLVHRRREVIETKIVQPESLKGMANHE